MPLSAMCCCRQDLELQALTGPEFFSYIAPPATATKVMTTIKLLSAHANDEQYLSTDRQDWLPLVSHQNQSPAPVGSACI